MDVVSPKCRYSSKNGSSAVHVYMYSSIMHIFSDVVMFVSYAYDTTWHAVQWAPGCQETSVWCPGSMFYFFSDLNLTLFYVKDSESVPLLSCASQPSFLFVRAGPSLFFSTQYGRPLVSFSICSCATPRGKSRRGSLYGVYSLLRRKKPPTGARRSFQTSVT